MPRKRSCDATCGGSMLFQAIEVNSERQLPIGSNRAGVVVAVSQQICQRGGGGEGGVVRIFVGAEPNLQPPLLHLLPLNQNRRASPSSWGKMGQRTTRHRLTFLWERHRTSVPAGTLAFSLYLACRDARRLHRPDGMFPNLLYFNFTQPSGRNDLIQKKKKKS